MEAVGGLLPVSHRSHIRNNLPSIHASFTLLPLGLEIYEK